MIADEQIDCCRCLQEQDCRDTVFELFVQGLVVKGSHGTPRPDASSTGSQCEQHRLGDSPGASPRFPFVYAVCNKRDDIDGEQE